MASMVKRPPALFSSEYVTGKPSGSVAEAVMPTAVPAAAVLATWLAAGSVSIGTESAVASRYTTLCWVPLVPASV